MKVAFALLAILALSACSETARQASAPAQDWRTIHRPSPMTPN